MIAKLTGVCLVASIAPAILFGAGCSTPGMAAGPAETGWIGPYVVWSGADSRVEDPEIVRITTEAEWVDLWLRHKGLKREEHLFPDGRYDFYYDPAGLPRVDFEQCMVLAIFGGKRWNCAGIEPFLVEMRADRVHVGFRHRTYQVATIALDDPADTIEETEPDVPDRPFAILVMRRSAKALVVEESVRRSKDQIDPDWEERARIPEIR